MNRYRFVAFALAILMGFPAPLAAQKPFRAQKQMPKSAETTAVLIARADSAFRSGELELSWHLYKQVFKAEPGNARAIYQLGRLSPPGSKLAIKLFRRYILLQPKDPWGYIALAESYAKAGLLGPAVRWYVEAVILAPTEQDPWIGLGKILERAGRADASVEVYERWARVRPHEALAWQTLGGAHQRAGQLRESAYAFEHALTIKDDGATLDRLRHVLSSMAPAITPLYGRSWDSDGNVVYQGAVTGNWMLFERTRLGVKAGMTQADDPSRSATAKEFALTTSWQPHRHLFLDGRAGLVQTDGNNNALSSHITPVLDLRTRWRGPANQPAGELRINVVPLTSTPKLLAQPVVLKELQGLLHVPVYSPMRLRALGQMGNLKSDTHQNTRLGYGGALAFRLTSDLELSGQYRVLAYRHPTKAGYFAPELLQTLELAPYLEYSRFWPFMLTLDLGLGMQRAIPHGGAAFSWGRAFRLWALVAWNFQPGRQLALEIESYETITPGEALIPDYGWRSSSVVLSLRWGLGPTIGANLSGRRTALEAGR
jgi:tetratricopeptide (TPR) repeat protein